MSARLPTTVSIASYNLWLIPFGSPWNLGRTYRCAGALTAAANEMASEVDDTALQIVAVQEAWAYRVGLFWPVFWLISKLEAAVLRSGLVAGKKEPKAYSILRNLYVLCMAIFTLVAQGWVPLLRSVLWNPKPRLASALKHHAKLPWQTDGVEAFRRLPPWVWRPCLMDSGTAPQLLEDPRLLLHAQIRI